MRKGHTGETLSQKCRNEIYKTRTETNKIKMFECGMAIYIRKIHAGNESSIIEDKVVPLCPAEHVHPNGTLVPKLDVGQATASHVR